MTGKEDADHKAWQERLLPLMVRMLVVLAAFFFVASFVQLFYLHTRIENAPILDVAQLGCTSIDMQGAPPEVRLPCQRLRTAALLESNVIARRYHQANVAMMSRVWSHYLGFVTGMILALVGAAFILGQVRAPRSELEAKAESFQATLKSASPGLALCVLGVVLMMTTIITYHSIETTDKSTYFEAVTPGETSGKPDLALKPPPPEPSPKPQGP